MRTLKRTALIVVIATLVIAMSGCACVANQVAKTVVQGTTGVKVDQNGKQMSVTGKNGETATLSSGEGKLPDNLPSDVPVYNGSIKSSTNLVTAAGTNYTFTIDSPDDFATISLWYKKALTDKGWKVNTVVNGADNSAMVSASKGDKANILITMTQPSSGKGEEIAVVADFKK